LGEQACTACRPLNFNLTFIYEYASTALKVELRKFS
jgi:hypothetical protein